MGWTAAWRALTLSLLLIVMAGEAPVLHRHCGATPAFYDEACPLSQLFGSRSEVSPVRRVDLAQPLPVIGLVVLPAPPDSGALSVLPFDPRGPPLSG
jgi:hypothetical protein